MSCDPCFEGKSNRKAKRLRSKLKAAFDDWARRQSDDPGRPKANEVIPFIRPRCSCTTPTWSANSPRSLAATCIACPRPPRLVWLRSPTSSTVSPPPGTKIHENAIASVIKLIGLRAHQREIGAYLLDQQPLEDGPGWQDWLATHKHLRDQRRRIRFRVTPEGSTEEVRRRLRLLAEHEMSVMQHLHHDAIRRPQDYVDSELGPGLIYPYDPNWQRLDLWLAEQSHSLSFDSQLSLIRQLGEALQYAHGKNVVHRGQGQRGPRWRHRQHRVGTVLRVHRHHPAGLPAPQAPPP